MTSLCSSDVAIVRICSLPVDWGATGDFLSGIGTVAGAGAVIYAARKGADTFKMWRRQKHEERRMEVAEQILTLAYKVRQILIHLRSSNYLQSEIAEAEEELRRLGLLNDNVSDERKNRLSIAQVLFARAQAHSTRFEELTNILSTVKVIFGGRVEASVNRLLDIRWEVFKAARSYGRFDLLNSAYNPGDGLAYLKKLESVFWARSPLEDVDEDVTNALLNSAIKDLEYELQPIIRTGAMNGNA